MSDAVEWLPQLTLFTDYDGNWPEYLEAIYALFRRDFVDSTPSFPGKRFALKRHPMSLGKEATFWHLIAEGEIEADREPDLRRCERIEWPRPIIESFETDRIRWWKSWRGRNLRINIAVRDFSYVVILDERTDFILLWTAYYVEREHRRRKLERECREWWASSAGNG